ncbi:lysozyme [Cupriavidus sp. SK-4]|uniref:glycoside hydrolase family protein n=1 Tax=Cupriavidus sp. SK-4 TaxID=574750 RepID=UPI00044787E2|nr:hypothetical protein [Cupriavidus sp. SK-4]EYS96160.1 lysozyme [Cupriavidus sp. SK-4]
MSQLRIAVAPLTMSAVGFTAWQASEGFTERPVIPTRGDVLTIGHGSTRYEDGRPVRMSDPPITRERGAILARNLMVVDERRFVASLPGVRLHQEGFDLYVDFVGQFGIGNWSGSSMRKRLLAGDYAGACQQRCYGVWTRPSPRMVPSLILALCLVVSGCSTTPPRGASFPNPPELLMRPPPQLKTLPPPSPTTTAPITKQPRS